MNVHSLKFKDSSETAVVTLLLPMFLSFKFKIIKFEKMKTYKNQSGNEHQRWFRDAKIKMMSISKYFVINKIKILWYIQFLKYDSII